jgi:F-type H+-transporting ATPase subunit alpha
VPVEEQVLVVYAGTNGWVDTVPVLEVRRFESEMREHFRANHAELLDEIRTTGNLPAAADLDKALQSFLDGFDTGTVD